LSSYISISPSSFQEDFIDEIKEDPKLNKAFTDLWLLHRNFYPNTNFFNYTVQGYINKATEEKKYKLFSKQKVNKRYLVIDFTKTNLYLKEKKESLGASKTISFRHLIKSYA